MQFAFGQSYTNVAAITASGTATIILKIGNGPYMGAIGGSGAGGSVTGNVGGGVWYASSHTTHPDAVKTFLEFIVTNDKTAGTGGLPAYKAAAEKWLTQQGSGGFYVGNFKSAIETAAESVWNGWGYPNFSPETAWAKVITPGLAGGKTLADLASDWQQEMLNEAQVVGYDTN